MARTDDDSWEITESVGATALGVAAARAADTESDDPLINDPYARIFLDTVGDGVWNWYGAPELPAEVVAAEPDMPARMRALVNYFATRTKFFDTSFIEAAGAGIRQAVILAAGLDARSWRLPWPDGTTVYELDQDKVLDFKAATLREHGANPRANRVAVAADLRQDWPMALQQNGFDPSLPSVWSVEGLLMYLPAPSQDLLFERIHSLAAPGSHLAVEDLGPEFADPEGRAQRRERMDRIRDLMARTDSKLVVPTTDELWYFEEREDVGSWLRRHGWDVTSTPSEELLARYGRALAPDLQGASPTHWFISAQRSTAG
ncbi:class I SAM-dependent methyltransferase [Mycobacterium vicinigordonae]|uniref:S-adenosyl-L-methionine-dependent methyltransferase n=1 Tax=Mycobacterium vicinigordonae TaxID=1719132 RepID=A0A7D6E290_9MYCO|nr:class I SAM-dependent methyltransferase [Mycobacterium vicinigordonae]QLL09250.1 class I SAM-dependent methyltransferase [Mycobacterium vicinigordonae]